MTVVNTPSAEALLQAVDDLSERLIIVSPSEDATIRELVEERARELTAAQPKASDAVCDTCGGDGWVEGSTAGCCGNYRNQECCGNPIPVRTQDQCPECGGSGVVIAPSPQQAVTVEQQLDDWHRQQNAPRAPQQAGARKVTDADVESAVRQLFGNIYTPGAPLTETVRAALESFAANK